MKFRDRFDANGWALPRRTVARERRRSQAALRRVATWAARESAKRRAPIVVVTVTIRDEDGAMVTGSVPVGELSIAQAVEMAKRIAVKARDETRARPRPAVLRLSTEQPL